MGVTTSPVLHLDALNLQTQAHGDIYEAHMASFASPLGTRLLGGRLVVVSPGKRAWPFHGHHANEELFVILSGTGRLRYTDGDHALRAGDVALCPAKGAAGAHQIINDDDVDLRYLAISTMNQRDVIDYPGVAEGICREPGLHRWQSRHRAIWSRFALGIYAHDPVELHR